MKSWACACLLLLGVWFGREVLEPNPPPKPEPGGCVVIVTNLGPIVVCR